VGGGGLISGAHAAIAQAVSPRERGRYQAYFSGMFALASVIGPVAGGWLVERMSWRWVFALNVPLAAAAVLVVRSRLAALPVPGRRRDVDAAGASLLSLGLAALLIAITRAGQGMPWLDAPNLGWLGLAATLLAAFGWRERRLEDPVLPLGLLGNRLVALGLLTQFIGHGTMITLTVMVPLEIQLAQGLPPGAAAAQLIAFSLGPPVGSFVAGRTMAASGRYRPQQMIGAVGNAIAVLALAWAVHAGAPQWAAVALLFAAGVTFGLQFPTTLVAIQNASPAEHVGASIAAVNFARSLGGALGVAVLSTILLELLRRGAPELATVSAGADVMRALTETGGDALRARMRPVAEHAFTVVFVLCATGGLASLALFRAMPERTLRG
jgi:MFS family permease